MSGKERPAPQPLAARLDRGLPMVAIVGRPNAGKSTLFNRLVGRRLAIVEDVPGVTRDRHYAHAFVNGREFILIDTGGFDPESDDPMSASIADQVRLALEECDIVICVLDATADPTPADAQAIDLLRRTVKPTIYVANKADSRARVHSAMSHYQLGIDEILPVSALHALGIGDLEDALAPYLPEPRAEVSRSVPRSSRTSRSRWPGAKPSPPAPKLKSRRPGRSGRTCRGSRPVTRPPKPQRSAGAQAT